jgi:glycosyltransferase involved in cell wall biosynthesis
MRVGIHNRYWSTMGGGERYAAGMAEALSPHHDVVLFAGEAVDRHLLEERLHVDLTGVAVEVVGTNTERAEAATATVDVFINASYMSRLRNLAEHGIYVVHFPSGPPKPPGWMAPLVAAGRRLLGEDGTGLSLESGFDEPEWLLQRQGSWIADGAHVSLDLPDGRHHLVFDIARIMPAGLSRIHLNITGRQDGRTIGEASAEIGPRSSRWASRVAKVELEIDVARSGPVEIELRTEATASVGGRRLGAAVVGISVGRGVAARLRGAYPQLLADRHWLGYLSSYDKIVSNSEYGRDHAERLWRCEVTALQPPVTMHRPGDKQPIILSVGRFFAAKAGHSKKQLEMVQAFGRLVERTGTDWELHLVGGVDDEGGRYVQQVREASAGLAVVFHENATGAEVARLYGEASIYWHAAGFGEDAERHPDRLEHFGITTVEAMSAGAVPIVIGAGGQLESVENGVTGLHWTTVDELVDHTAKVIADADYRAELADAARAAASRFSPDVFAKRVNELVSEVTRG